MNVFVFFASWYFLFSFVLSPLKLWHQFLRFGFLFLIPSWLQFLYFHHEKCYRKANKLALCLYTNQMFSSSYWTVMLQLHVIYWHMFFRIQHVCTTKNYLDKQHQAAATLLTLKVEAEQNIDKIYFWHFKPDPDFLNICGTSKNGFYLIPVFFTVLVMLLLDIEVVLLIHFFLGCISIGCFSPVMALMVLNRWSSGGWSRLTPAVHLLITRCSNSFVQFQDAHLSPRAIPSMPQLLSSQRNCCRKGADEGDMRSRTT